MTHHGQPSVFIDGHVGTTGLRIRELLGGRTDIRLLTIPEDRRKDAEARRELLNAADLVVLCLPDDAAREAIGLITNERTRVIDASSAHRVAQGWTYGLPEMNPEQRTRVAQATRVSNPGCYPTPVILAMRPLIEAGVVSAGLALTVHAISGYTGGGRTLIERWENPALGLGSLPYPAPYALDRVHKHVPEMTRHSLLSHEPLFIPSVAPFRCGMRVVVPLHRGMLAGPPRKVWEVLSARYAGEPFVRIGEFREAVVRDEHSLDPRALNDTNVVELQVIPSPLGHVTIIGRLDNLGKGAAGAAVQNLNLMLGLPETAGLAA
jgi:N-acetyl-gamma-glutamyl-phosphate reductase